MFKNYSSKASFLLLDKIFSAANQLENLFFSFVWQLSKNRDFPVWRKATVLAGVFFILIISSFSLNWLVNELAWRGQQADAWWAKGFALPIDKDREYGNIKIFSNYLSKPIAKGANRLSVYFNNNFFLPIVLAAEETSSLPWQGELTFLSHRQINIKEGSAITIEVKYRNTGVKTWKNSGPAFLSINVAEPYYHQSQFKHDFWHSPDQPAKLLEDEVRPGGIGTFRFAIKAPLIPGKYKEYFELSAENVSWLKMTRFDIALAVGSNNFLIAQPTSVVSQADLENKIMGDDASVINEEMSLVDNFLIASTTKMTDGESLKMNEPLIRVGLYKTTNPVIISADGPYFIKDAAGNVVKDMAAEYKSVVTFDVYSKNFLVGASQAAIIMPEVVFSSLSTSTIFTIVNYENRPKWDVSWNDNRYRGNLEISYGEKSASPWVINELPLEDYIRGIKETSEVSPIEYQKAIAVAARTYALWQLVDATKHAGNNFTVDAVFDQVYRGYNAEVQVPKFSAAVRDTEGLVVTYKNELALTPYFAQSDGRTRSYQEVWFGAAKPWLVSVLDPSNSGLRMWGHGVGMSARGALIMASKQNKTFSQILKYYYTGIEIERWYRSGNKLDVLLETSNEDGPRL